MFSSSLSRAVRLTSLLAVAAVAAAIACARNQAEQSVPAQPLPLKLAPAPTVAAITERDLMTRIYLFADDSMEGRRAGSEGNQRATAYIERELRRLGLEPAGDGGSFFQAVPIVRRALDRNITLSVDDRPLTLGADFVPYGGRGNPRDIDGARVIYGGVWRDAGTVALTAEQVKGRAVVFTLPEGDAEGGDEFESIPRITGSSPLVSAAAVIFVNLEEMPQRTRRAASTASIGLAAGRAGATMMVPRSIYVSRRAAEQMFGAAPVTLAPGTLGRTLRGSIANVETPTPARNVVAVLRGSDERLRGQYVALGAHNDHIGVLEAPVDHDSLRAWNLEQWRRRGMYAGLPALTREQRSAIAVNVDSLRRVRPARRDSINNGADDDGSGSMALLEIAELLASAKERPRRSVVFVWHTGEEIGLLGSRWFADHPTVPRDSIVTQINVDMIGRGRAEDIQGGGPGYLAVVGARRLSSELGEIVDAANRAQPTPLDFDYRLDASGHPENIYCRSDHYNYARYGIPVVFYFTNIHHDYHQVTDEPQYLDYPHYLRITRYIADVTTRVANLAHRPLVDGQKMDPNGWCQQ